MNRSALFAFSALFCLLLVIGCKSIDTHVLHLGPCPPESVSLGNSNVVVVEKGGRISIHVKLCVSCPGVTPPYTEGVKGKVRLGLDDETRENLGVNGGDLADRLSQVHNLDANGCTTFELGPYSNSYKPALVGVKVKLIYTDKATGKKIPLGEIEITESAVEPVW